jgi:ABC-type phosphate/phosphonate transport system substrate-binding protein
VTLLQQGRKILTALVLVLVLSFTTACGTATQARGTNNLPAITNSVGYQQLERGNTAGGQNFGDWVVETAKGLVKDAYVRDNNKLGVVITPTVNPNEVQTLAKSLLQGFHKNFPNQDLTVLMYAPDKKLIMTAEYDVQSKQVEYKGA